MAASARRFRELDQLKRWRGVFLKPADFVLALCAVDILPVGFSAGIVHKPVSAPRYLGMVTPPILDNKHTSSPSVFAPSALLREARRQKQVAAVDVPAVCILDPDGDLVRNLRDTARAKPFEGWPCYHTELDIFELAGRQVGIIGRVVGSSFAVLVAEELFASNCRLLVSLTSAGQIVSAGQPPYFVIIDRALRDEGTSYHYAPPAEFARRTRRLSPGRRRRSRGGRRDASSVQAGQPTRRSAKLPKRSRRPVPRASSRSRWRQPRSTALLA